MSAAPVDLDALQEYRAPFADEFPGGESWQIVEVVKRCREAERIAEAAREYTAARLAMSENKQDQLAMICEVDRAWSELVRVCDEEQQ